VKIANSTWWKTWYLLPTISVVYGRSFVEISLIFLKWSLLVIEFSADVTKS
jgi:hypothetical protein